MPKFMIHYTYKIFQRGDKMNNVSLIGRLTADPELKTTNGGIAFTRFSIGVDRAMSKDRKEERVAENKAVADFPRISAFGRMADNVCKYLSKGSLVSVTGEVRTGSYDGTDGEKKFFMEITGRRIQFLDTKKSAQPAEIESEIDIEVHDDIPF